MQLLLAYLSMTVEEKKKAEENTKRFEEEKVKIEHNFADIIYRHKIKVEEDKLKMNKIKNMLVTSKIPPLYMLCVASHNSRSHSSQTSSENAKIRERERQCLYRIQLVIFWVFPLPFILTYNDRVKPTTSVPSHVQASTRSDLRSGQTTDR
jgi:hypothetical protein